MIVFRSHWRSEAAASELSRLAMSGRMASVAQCDEVLFGIVAGVATKFLVMNLKIRHRTARLTSPAVATQDLLPKSVVCNRIQPQAPRPRSDRAHEAFSLKPSRNSCRCSPGRNLKNLVIENSSVSGSPLSRLAPARKSAQIISRQ